MCNKDTVPTELEKSRQNLLDQRRIHHHVVPDARKLLYLKRNRYLRIDKGGKSVHDLTAADLHRSNLDNAVIHRGEARCLNIKDDKIILQRLPSVAGDDLLQVVHQIRLDAVQYLKEILLVRVRIARLRALSLFLLPEVVPYMVRVGKALDNTVVCDGNRPVPPFVSALYNVLCLGHTVHVAHLCMAVKLHTFMRRCIHSRRRKIRNLLDSRDCTDRQLMVELIQIDDTLDLDKAAGLHSL